MGRRRHRLTSFLGSDATTPPPSTSGAECATKPSSSYESYPSASASEPLGSACSSSSVVQSKSCSAARPLVNRFIWPRPPAAGAGAAATELRLPLKPSGVAAQLGLVEDEDEEERDLVRRKSIRLTSEVLGLEVAGSGWRGGSGHAPPSIPHASGAGFAAFRLLVFLALLLDLLRLIWPMQETLGDEASGVRYPLPLPPWFLLPLLRPPPRASGGTMETMGPEKALRWLKDDFPRTAKFVVEDEKDAAVDRRKAARAAPAPLRDLACLLGFLSIAGLLPCVKCERAYVTDSLLV